MLRLTEKTYYSTLLEQQRTHVNPLERSQMIVNMSESSAVDLD